MKCKIQYLFLLFLLLNIVARSQNVLIPKLASLASDFTKSIRVDKEKFFVQTNKWYYTAGEDIWLRAYCINALSHQVMRKSKSLFVDVVNDQDSLVSQIMLNNGLLRLDGRITLPSTLPEGYYWLRAYTRDQLNQDPDGIYVQGLYVFDSGNRGTHLPVAEKADPVFNPEDTCKPCVRFYPEGGNVIAGNYNRIAFASFNQGGKQMDVVGYVTDNANIVVAKYSASSSGLGSFSFFADGSMNYTAHTIFGSGKIVNTQLPNPNADGYQLSVTSQTVDSIFFQVSLGDSAYEKFKSSYVLGISRDSLCYAAMGKGMYVFGIAKNSFPGGKASMLLFNDEEKIVSQRDLYIKKSNSPLRIVADRRSYGPRQKVILSVSTNETGNADVSEAILSVAITNDQAGNENTGQKIMDRLKNDNIEFAEKDNTDSEIDSYSSDHWDLIMLTQPFHYLGWQKRNGMSQIRPIWEQSDIEVTNLTGHVTGKKNLPLKNKIVTIISGNSEILETDTTDANGKFHFKLPDNIFDSTALYFQVSNSSGAEMEDSIEVDMMRFPRFSTPVALKKRFSLSNTKQLENFKLYQLDSIAIGDKKGLLKPVTITARKKIPVTYDESKIVSPFSKIIPGDKIGLSPHAIDAALLSVAGVSLMGGLVVIRGGGIPNGAGGIEPLLFVDGSQINLASMREKLLSYLESLDTRNIDFIEVLEGADATVYGPGSDNGVIYLHTLNGGRPIPESEKKGLKLIYAKGYYVAPIFQEPDYDKKEIRNSPYPDHRSTIYWNGNIKTQNRGKSVLQFFTSDAPINYNVFVIAVTSDGNILSANGKIIGE
ncbi:MAG TPA: hypothetical protein VKR53_12245 [Puia sp.]|nr:hypothetical protein [Puia sp.]